MRTTTRLFSGFGASVLLHAGLLAVFWRPPSFSMGPERGQTTIAVELAEPKETMGPDVPVTAPPPAAKPPTRPAPVRPTDRAPAAATAPPPPDEARPEPGEAAIVDPARKDAEGPTPPPEPRAPGTDEPIDPRRVDLATRVPGGARLVVYVRADRLRGTPWAQGFEAVLAPTPDYRALLGGSRITLADAFETVVIATPDPRDVTATFLAVRVRGDEAALRRRLAGTATQARLAWETRPGGLVGIPQVHVPGDPRVVVSPEAGWLALARPEHVAMLLTPATPAPTPTPAPAPTPSATPTPPPDAALAPKPVATTIEPVASAAPPTWVASLARLEGQAFTDAPGILAVIGVADLGDRLEALPGAPPAPTRGTLVVASPRAASATGETLVTISGTLAFKTAADATQFVAAVAEGRHRALDGILARGVLRGVGALGLVESAVLTRTEAEVAISAQASGDDLTELLAAAARWTDSFFNRR